MEVLEQGKKSAPIRIDWLNKNTDMNIFQPQTQMHTL